MLEININEEEARKLYMEKLEEYFKKMKVETLFWDSDELMRQTTLSWNTIQKEFFYEEGFPKRKLERKWLFPAEETKEYLLNWLKGKRSH